MKCWLAIALLISANTVKAESIGDWTIGRNDNGAPYMFVMNDSGSFFGKWCDVDDQSCSWLMLTPTLCIENSKSLAMVNAESGASSFQTFCIGSKTFGTSTLYRNGFLGFDNIEKLAAEGGTLGIVIPLEHAQFKALKFRLIGVAAALKRFEALTLLMPPSKSTKDKIL